MDPEYRTVRFAYVTFYVLALPLVLFAILFVTLVWQTWALRGVGVMEGPEPSDAEIISLCLALSIFAIGYIAVWLRAPSVTQAQRAWLPFAAHFPALTSILVIVGCWSTHTAVDRVYSAIYPAFLLAILSLGIFFTLRIHANQSRARPSAPANATPVSPMRLPGGLRCQASKRQWGGVALAWALGVLAHIL
jgi:hypothetical protein